ncbi:MAG: hypothetical protein JW720_16005 [Sedimentisphaerales bacterium]|nr:hypothetical protein [Sedimentisphaerales bacterium]
MIKTLQISSILAVILAIGLFVSSVVFGVHKDDAIESFLASPSVKEQFAKSVGGAAKKRSAGQVSPLVAQAERFGSILNPPKPTVVAKQVTTTDVPKLPEIPEPPQSKPKFRLFGTVVCESNPNLSLALLDEPGKGLHMVRQGAAVMHLTIEEVKDGVVVVRDAQGTSEIMVEEGPAPTSVVSGPSLTSRVGSPTPVTPAASRSRTSIPPSPSSGRRGPVAPASVRSRLSNEENARLAALGDRLKAMKESSASKVDAALPEGDDNPMALFQKMLAEKEAKEAAAKSGSSDTASKTTAPPAPRPRPNTTR